MDLGPIRKKIDGIDGKLVALVNQRLALAAKIGKIKRQAGGETQRVLSLRPRRRRQP